MLIPQITYLSKTTGTINAQSVMTISLRNTSQTNSTISTVTWAYGIVVGPGTATMSNATDTDVCIIIDNTADITLSVTLTVTDSDGFNCQARARIVKSGADVTFFAMNVDAFILPSRLVEFTPIDNVHAIDGAPVITDPAYSEYWFDKENNGVWDVQDNSGVIPTFTNIYGTLTSYEAKVANLNATVYTEIGFNPVITNPKGLIVTSFNDCTELSAYSQTEDYLSRYVERGDLDNSDMKYLDVTLTTNCCTTDAITCRLYPLYGLSISQGAYTNTGTNIPAANWPLSCVGTDNYRLFTVPITIAGIDPTIIATLQYTKRGIAGYTTVTATNTFTLEVLLEGYGPGSICGLQVAQTNTVIITTTQGLVYTVVYTLTDDGGIVSMTLTTDSITTPTADELNPCGLVITEEPSNTVLYLSSINFGLEADITLPDGIYQVTINDSGISNETVFGCTFVNCGMYCLVIQALANECPTAISILYEALVYSANCDNMSCQNLCDLYEMLTSLIDECDCTILMNNQPTISSDCGCNK